MSGDDLTPAEFAQLLLEEARKIEQATYDLDQDALAATMERISDGKPFAYVTAAIAILVAKWLDKLQGITGAISQPICDEFAMDSLSILALSIYRNGRVIGTIQ